MKKIFITGIALMTLVLSSCGKSYTDADDNYSVSVNTTKANQEDDYTSDDEICDGYFAPTIVDDAFLEAYSLVEGIWLTEDKNEMLKVFFNEDDNLYYLGMYQSNEEELVSVFPDYNMYSICISDDEIYKIDMKKNEKHIVFDCNNGLMQTSDDLLVDENREYIRYIEHNKERSEIIFYQCNETDIPGAFKN